MDENIKQSLLEVSADVLEVALDQLMSEGVLRDIPVLGVAVGVAKVGKSISDRVFLEKVKRFVVALEKVSEREKQDFLDRMVNDEGSLKKAGQAVVLILNKLDDLEKPEILAQVFAAYMKGSVTLADFRRLAIAIDQAFVDDLRELARSIWEDRNPDADCLNGLLRTGLTRIAPVTIAFDRDYSATSIQVTDLGEKLASILNGKPQ